MVAVESLHGTIKDKETLLGNYLSQKGCVIIFVYLGSEPVLSASRSGILFCLQIYTR